MADVVVVGAGVIGLTCAMRLQQAGAQVTVVSADPPEATTSWIAAAVWYPTHTRGDARTLAWCARTFEEFTAQAGQQVPGVHLRPTRMLLRAPAPTPWWAPVVTDFGCAPPAEVPAGYAGEWRFTVPAVEMGPYLQWQLQQVTQAGGTVLRRRLRQLSDVAGLAPVTVNATGLGARQLAGDPAVHPIRGRIVLVDNPGITTSVRDEDDPAGTTYVHPRPHDIVLGGTFEPGAHDTTVDEQEGRAILARCTALVPQLAGVRARTQLVGLRPGRHGGARLEVDPQAAAGRLIHNYGHGGAGMTLSWGCADDVLALVQAG